MRACLKVSPPGRPSPSLPHPPEARTGRHAAAELAPRPRADPFRGFHLPACDAVVPPARSRCARRRRTTASSVMNAMSRMAPPHPPRPPLRPPARCRAAATKPCGAWRKPRSSARASRSAGARAPASGSIFPCTRAHSCGARPRKTHRSLRHPLPPPRDHRPQSHRRYERTEPGVRPASMAAAACLPVNSLWCVSECAHP